MCYKTKAGEGSHACTLGSLFVMPLGSTSLNMPAYSNFQINEATGGPFFKNYNFYCSKNANKTLKFHPKVHLIGNCYQLEYLEPRGIG